MKKLISLLSASVLVLSTSVLMVSCVPVQKENPLNIGKNITKVENAVDYEGSNNDGKSDFTNYFIVGDSLSDVDGITTMLKNKLIAPIKNVDVDLKIKIPGIPFALPLKTNLSVETNINLSLGDKGIDGYGFEQDGMWHSAFMNGKPAGYLLNEKLGFDPIKSSSMFSKELDNNMRNYSIGGATASKSIDPIMGLVLNDVTVDNQAKALISQHHVEKTDNDLVFFEIGGNDLFALAEIDVNNKELQNKLMNDAMKRIRTTMFTLLNNGIENIVIGTPPDITEIPRYSSEEPERDRHLKQLSLKFNTEMLKVINEVKEYYPSSIQTYDIFTEFKKLKDRFQQKYDDSLTEKPLEKVVVETKTAYTNKTEIDTSKPITIDAAYFDSGKNEIVKVPFGTITLKTGDELSIVFEKDKGIDLKLGAKILSSKTLTLSINADIKVKAVRENLPEADINSFFFTDFVHPTKLVHELVADDVYELTQKFAK